MLHFVLHFPECCSVPQESWQQFVVMVENKYSDGFKISMLQTNREENIHLVCDVLLSQQPAGPVVST